MVFWRLSIAIVIKYYNAYNQFPLKLIIYIQQAQFISLSEANSIVGSVESMHCALILNGYYLPSLKSAAITSNYLLSVALNKCFRIKREEVKQGAVLKKVIKLSLFDQLYSKLTQQKITIGFDQDHLPDKEWMINVLYTIDEKNPIFNKGEEIQTTINISKDDLSILKQLDTSMGRKKVLRFFRRTPGQIILKKQNQLKKKLTQIKQRLERKKSQNGKIEAMIKSYQIKLDEVQNDPDMKIQKQQKL